MNKWKFLLVMCMILLSATLVGCGEKEEISTYKEQMEQFCRSAKEYDDAINAIDPYADDASFLLLEQLDGLDFLFQEMAGYEVPSEFEGVATLAANASENMSSAVALFHQAYEGEEYQQNIADAAGQYYERANQRVQDILMILHGQIPEEMAFTDESSEENNAE